MGKVVVLEWVSLDGVMQGPGRPDEDERDGFARGGWAQPFGDEETAAAMGERMGGDRAFLFGRRTYEDLLPSWDRQGGPFREAFMATPKHVVSGDPATRLDWPASELVTGDVPAAVAALKAASAATLVVMGSGVLVQALLAAGLVDELLLLVAPLVLGAGRRLFPDGGVPAALALRSSATTAKGVALLGYRPSM